MEVRDYIALADNLCTERAAFEGGWDEMRRIIMPRATGNAHPDSCLLYTSPSPRD